MDVTLDFASFSRQIQEVTDELQMVLSQAIRKIALDLFDDILKQTPVDKGTLRGSWVLGVNMLGLGEGDTSQSAQSKLSTAELGDFIIIANHMPYARVIEYGEYPGQGPKTTADGYSTQAPRGIVRVAVQRRAMNFRRSLDKMKRKPGRRT